MNFSEVISKAKECIGDKCHACPVSVRIMIVRLPI